MNPFLLLVRKRPDGVAAGRIQSNDIVRTLSGVHHSVNDERRNFTLLERTRLEDPFQFEIFRAKHDASLVSAELVYVNADPKTMKAAPLPEDLRSRVQDYEKVKPLA